MSSSDWSALDDDLILVRINGGGKSSQQHRRSKFNCPCKPRLEQADFHREPSSDMRAAAPWTCGWRSCCVKEERKWARRHPRNQGGTKFRCSWGMAAGVSKCDQDESPRTTSMQRLYLSAWVGSSHLVYSSVFLILDSRSISDLGISQAGGVSSNDKEAGYLVRTCVLTT